MDKSGAPSTMPSNNNGNTPSVYEAFLVWLKIGVLSFGGPAAQIALMHRLLVDEKRWLNEQTYLNALSFCMLLPGPEAMQLATYAGWRLHGMVGGLIAGLLFVLPGALVVLALAATYAALGDVPLMAALFLGIKAAVLIIVLEALLKVAKRALKRPVYWWVAAVTFIAIFFFSLPFPLIILAAGLLGYCLGADVDAEIQVPQSHSDRSFKRLLQTVIIGLAIWLLPLWALNSWLGPSILVDIGAFFSRLAVVTFGGAYAVLAYMGQAVVSDFSWLTPGEMMDGLGLAETTPGPLILVTEFVGYLAAEREDGPLLGLAAAGITLWTTFVPCFLWIFAGAPHIDWICRQPRLKGALTAISAAVVGVILNLSIWFALHVLFETVTLHNISVLTLWVPEWTSIDIKVVALSFLCGYMLLKWAWPVERVLLISAAISGVMVFSF